MDFYYVDKTYIDYLKNYETNARGFTKVPNVEYEKRDKFVFGAVIQMHEINYYVAVSSYKKNNESTMLIVDNDNNREVKGSLRFNYMIPVPTECLTHIEINKFTEPSYKRLVRKELKFCRENEERIKRKAQSIYNKVLAGKNKLLVENSCDFKLLEEACKQYECR